MESFKKFKKRIISEMLIKSIVLAISLGLITFSVPYLIIKVKGIEFNLLYLILIGLGVMLITFGLIFLILKPNDKKIAKRLDKELNLNEKVQTMIEYKDNDNLMVSLQRENTLDILSKTSIKNIAMKFGVLFFAFTIISVTASVVAFAVPGYEEPEHIHEFINGVCSCGELEYIDPDYNLDDWTVKAIYEIIEEVRKSASDANLKQKYITKLDELINELESTTKESEVKTLVERVITYTKVELDKVNTSNEIYTVLKVSDYNAVVTIATQINLLDSNELTKALENIIATINGSSDAIVELKPSFLDLLTKSNLDKEDELYKNLVKLAEAVNACANTGSSVNVNEEVKAAVKGNIDPIIEVVKAQAENKRVAVLIEEGLSEIFKLNNIDIEVDNLGGEETENEDNKKPIDDSNKGGLGTGEYLFGSDDLFFDPEIGSVRYGDVYFDYYGELLSEFEDGTLPEELREFFDYYFGILGGDANK